LRGEVLADCAEDHATIGADEIGFVVAFRQWVSPFELPVRNTASISCPDNGPTAQK
jgi:hypothetical protein